MPSRLHHALDSIMITEYSRVLWPLHVPKGNTIYSCSISRAAKAHLPLSGAKGKHTRKTIIQTPHVWNGLQSETGEGDEYDGLKLGIQ